MADIHYRYTDSDGNHIHQTRATRGEVMPCIIRKCEMFNKNVFIVDRHTYMIETPYGSMIPLTTNLTGWQYIGTHKVRNRTYRVEVKAAEEEK